MDKAYNGLDWENRPSTATPLDEINLDGISRALSLVDDRVINNYNTIQESVNNISINETTGAITIRENSGRTYGFNFATRIYNTIAANQQQVQDQFSQVTRNFGNVNDMLSAMDLKIDLNADTANAGLTALQTTITQNDGYYRQEMSGISQDLSGLEDALATGLGGLRNDITTYQSSITQTTQAIQLSVSAVSQSVDDLSGSLSNNVSILQSQINQTAGSIALKVSKFEVIDDLQQEFGSGIEITPDRLTFASTGSMVVNTLNFKLDEEGNAEFAGHVDMASGSVGGQPLLTTASDNEGLSVDHAVNAWKLRSAKIDDEGTRYYTFMTKNKNLIVNDSKTAGHNADNDKTVECSVGTKNYPWRKGYYKYLRVQEEKNGSAITHDVLPEGLPVTLYSSDWNSEDGVYTQTMPVNGIRGDMYLYLATESRTNLLLVYKNRIDVDTFSNNSVTFIAETQPASDVDVILLVEDYISPSIEGADISLDFDNETGLLSATWNSPDDFSKFITWESDMIVIEKWNEDLGDWQIVYNEVSYTSDQYADNPLVIGG